MRKTKTTPTKADLPDAVLLGQERSRLFWLLYDHHAVLGARWRSRRVDWRAVCAWAVAEGGMNAKGEPPTPNLAKQTWRRVCHLHAREKADREARQRPAHARSPAISQPPPVAASSPSHSHPPPAQGAASAEDVVDELNAFIRRRSGRS